MLSRLSLLAAVGFSLLALVSAANAQADLRFSGGNGSPLSINLVNPIAYTVNTRIQYGPHFLFAGAGDTGFFFDDYWSSRPLSGTLTFSINGGAPHSVNFARNRFTGGDEIPTDLMFGDQSLSGAVVGDVVTLSSGSITTISSVEGARPADGTYNTFLVDSGGHRASGNGVRIPEGNSATLLGVVLPGLGAVVVVRRRKC